VVDCGTVLQVRVGNKLVKLPLAKVRQITLDGETIFNQAEDLLTHKKFDEAIAKYDQARRASHTRVHGLLAKARRDQALKLKAIAATQPAEAEPGAAADPLSSLDALGADLGTQPMNPKDRQDWAGLDADEQKDALAKYDQDLAAWKKKHDCRGARIVWTMRLGDVTANGDGFLVSGKSGKGFKLTAEVAKLDKAAEAAVKAGKEVAVVGVIRDYSLQVTRSDNLFNTDLVQLGVMIGDAEIVFPAGAAKASASRPASQPASQAATSRATDQ
jgi:hypothetical protein